MIGKSAEEKVSRHLRENPTWPFRETTPHVFQFKVRDPKFWYSICLLFINTGAVLYLYFVAVADRSIIVINVFFYIMLLYQVANYYNERTYLLLSDKNMFQFYIGDKLAQESHYHNIYIRLDKLVASDERVVVNITLGGYGIESQNLSGSSDNYEVMRILAMKIAKRLNLNYFDLQDSSRQHKIRHRCPQQMIHPYTSFIHGVLRTPGSRRPSTAKGFGKQVSGLSIYP